MKLLEHSWAGFDVVFVIDEDDAVSIYRIINNVIYNDFTKTMISRREGEMAEGFYTVEKERVVEDQDLVYIRDYW